MLEKCGRLLNVDVQMDVNEAFPHLRHIVVSLLCTLLNIEEEAVSCLLGVIEVDAYKGGEGGHFRL